MAGAEVDVLNSGNIKDLSAEPLYELTYRAPGDGRLLITDENQFALYRSQTNDNSLILYQYALETDSLINTYTREFEKGWRCGISSRPLIRALPFLQISSPWGNTNVPCS